jgi:hypothetical protein
MNATFKPSIRLSIQSRIANQVKENSMKSLKALVIAASALAFVACNSTPPTPPAPPAPPSPPAPTDTAAPTIVSISPNNGAIGVAKDVVIKVKFSEPMNHSVTELAYQSGDMPSVAFSWSADGSELSIDPVGDLTYTAVGKLYEFKIKNNATDLAGNALTEVTSNFKTFKQKSVTLESVAALDGWVRSDGTVDAASTEIRVGDSGAVDNSTYRGFLSFDLSSLPTDLQSANIVSASLTAYQAAVSGLPYADLDSGSTDLLLDHVVYGPTLTALDFDPTVLGTASEFSGDETVGDKTLNVINSLKDDWTNRLDRGNRSQFRLRFPILTDGDGIFDAARFNSSDAAGMKPILSIVYLIP